jgi:CRISPR-associated protein Cpf1
MLYTRANYTSQTDPKTGWRKTIYLQKWSEESVKAQICEKFNEFGFDGKDYYFTYKVKTTGKEWTLYSGKDWKSLDRYRGKTNPNDTSKWQIEKQDIVTILDEVFGKYWKHQAFKFTIDKKNWTIKNEQGKDFEPTKKWASTAWESLRFAIDLIQQIRNSGAKSADWKPTRNDDFILSPVRDKHWKHFDSRAFLDKENKQEKAEMPTSWDANGAYNIARKWIIMFKRIKEKPENSNLFVSDEEWDEFLDE